MSDPDRTRVDLDAEREIDLGRVGRRILRRWWLVLPAGALGVVIGLLVSSGGGSVFQGKATVYLGQPLSPSASTQIQSYQTNPSVVNAIAKSDEVVDRVAEQVGLRPARLRAGVSTKAVSGSIARLGQTPLVEVIVRSPRREASEQAANAIAQAVVERVSPLAEAKIETLQAERGQAEQQIAAIDRALTELNRQLDGDRLTPDQRVTVAGQLIQLETRRGTYAEDRTQTDLALKVATEVERGQVITEARATKVAARSRRSGTIVGGVIGLVAGALLALILPFRRPPATAPGDASPEPAG